MAYINENQVLFNAQINGLVNIDSELSTESENPVQNKVVAEEFARHNSDPNAHGAINLFENKTWTFGKYVNASTGNVSTGAGNSCTEDFIEVEPSNAYVLKCEFSTYKNIFLYAYAYDENKTYLSSVGKINCGRNATGQFVVYTPSDESVKYFRLNFYFSGATEDVLTPTKTELYECSKMKGASAELVAKTIVNFGDSIANGVSGTSYCLQIANKNYMKCDNKAIGGATVRVNAENTNNILNQIETYTGTPDFVLFNGLTNDAYETVTDEVTALGAISDGFSATLDTSTFCGAFETILKTLLTKFAGAKILYVSTHINDARSYSSQKILTGLAIEMCNKWGIQVVDMFREGGLNSFIPVHKTTYIADGSHPNTLGYETFYVPMIEKAMKN